MLHGVASFSPLEVFSWKAAYWDCSFGGSVVGKMKILGNHYASSSIKQEAQHGGCLGSSPDTVTSCMTLGKLPNFSVPQVDHASVQWANYYSSYRIWLWRRLQGFRYKECLEWDFIPNLRIFCANLYSFCSPSLLPFFPFSHFLTLKKGATLGPCCFRTVFRTWPLKLSHDGRGDFAF